MRHATPRPDGAHPEPAAAPPEAGAVLRLVLLGRTEAWGLASAPLLPRSRKARAVLGILGLAGGAPVPRARLAALLWSRSAEAQRHGSLRQALHELNLALGEAAAPLLRADREAVALSAEGVWVDALEVARASPARPGMLELLAKAEGGGEVMPDLAGLDPAFDDWLRDRCRALRAHALGTAVAALAAARGEAARQVAARRLLALDPTHEAGWQVLGCGGGQPGAPPPAAAAGTAEVPPPEAFPAPAVADRPGSFVPVPSMPRPGLPHEGAARGGPSPLATATTPAAAGFRGARIGVVPPRPLGAGVAEHLPLGLAESLTAALACFRWIFVADGASLGAAGDRAEATARAMDLDFLLGGAIQARPDGRRLRLTFRLTDLREPGPGGAVAWAQGFDRDASDLLALQDTVAAEVVARLDPEILAIEAARAAARRGRHAGIGEGGGGATAAAAAHDLLLRALPAIHRLERRDFLEAGERLAAAARLAPGSAPVLSWHAYWYLFLVGQGWAEDEGRAMEAAERLAAAAAALDPMDAQGLTILGHVRAFLHHRVEEAIALHRRALSLNPNLAMAWVFLGMAESYAGAHDSALRRLDRYRELAPCHPHGFFFDAAWGIPLLLLGRHAEAAEAGRAATALQPGLSYPYKTYLSALGHLGLAAEAAADRAHYAEGLRRAGLP